MSVHALARRSTVNGPATPTAAPIYVDSDTNTVKLIPAGSGSTEVELVDSGGVAFTKSKTDTSTTPANYNLIRGDITLSGATIAVAGSSHVAGLRGSVTVGGSSTFTEGFLYGIQGRAILTGTMDEGSAARMTGVFGRLQLDGTVTDGQASAIWGDIAGNPTLTVNDQVYVGRFTNSMSAGKKAQAFQLMYGAADFLFEAGADGGTADWVVVAAVGGSQSHKLKVLINGTTFYIPLNTA